MLSDSVEATRLASLGVRAVGASLERLSLGKVMVASKILCSRRSFLSV